MDFGVTVTQMLTSEASLLAGLDFGTAGAVSAGMAKAGTASKAPDARITRRLIIYFSPVFERWSDHRDMVSTVRKRT
jgi:hypothetical protein